MVYEHAINLLFGYQYLKQMINKTSPNFFQKHIYIYHPNIHAGYRFEILMTFSCSSRIDLIQMLQTKWHPYSLTKMFTVVSSNINYFKMQWPVVFGCYLETQRLYDETMTNIAWTRSTGLTDVTVMTRRVKPLS